MQSGIRCSGDPILGSTEGRTMNKVVRMRDARAASAGSAARIHQDDGTPAALLRRGQHPGELVPVGSISAKPLDLEGTLQELLRQIQSLLDGLTGLEPEGARPSYESTMEIAELRVDRAGHRVLVAGEEIILTTLEFRLLVLMMERREQVLERGILLSEIWARNTNNLTRTVDTHVKRLRDKLKSAARFIQTVRGVGYRFSETPLREHRPARVAGELT
jgi:DNA-binding winged helix-turn-helix (wHTH) protein